MVAHRRLRERELLREIANGVRLGREPYEQCESGRIGDGFQSTGKLTMSAAVSRIRSTRAHHPPRGPLAGRAEARRRALRRRSSRHKDRLRFEAGTELVDELRDFRAFPREDSSPADASIDVRAKPPRLSQGTFVGKPCRLEHGRDIANEREVAPTALHVVVERREARGGSTVGRLRAHWRGRRFPVACSSARPMPATVAATSVSSSTPPSPASTTTSG